MLVPFLEAIIKGIYANLVYEGLGADANIKAGESFSEFKTGGGDLKGKAKNSSALDVNDLKMVLMLGLELLKEPHQSH